MRRKAPGYRSGEARGVRSRSPHPSSAAQLPPLLFLNSPFKESGKFLPRVQQLLLGIQHGDDALQQPQAGPAAGESVQVAGFPCCLVFFWRKTEMLNLLQQPKIPLGTRSSSCPPRAGEESKNEAKKPISPYLPCGGCEPLARSPPDAFHTFLSQSGNGCQENTCVYIQPRPLNPPG